MKTLFIIGNWKSYKTVYEAKYWFEHISRGKEKIANAVDKKVILCPPFQLLSEVKNIIEKNSLPLKLGAQDISPFDEGKYTGCVNGKQIKEFAEYVIIGHSERRDNFHEDNALLEKKVIMARQFGLIPIFCVQGKATKVFDAGSIVAYEPVSAIGSGHPDSPEDAEEVSSSLKGKFSLTDVIYGGSVDPANVHAFTSKPSISGVLVGGGSLDPEEFTQIVINA